MTERRPETHQPEAFAYQPEADAFDFKNSLDSIKASIASHLLLIIAIVVFTVGLVTTYIIVWPPVFEASVAVSADAQDDSQRNSFYQSWNIFRRESLDDEAVLMTADPVLWRVIEEMDLKYEDVYHPFSSYVIHLWGESRIGKNYRKIKYRFFPKPELPPGLTEEMVERFKVLSDFKKGVVLQPIGEANIALLIVRGPTPRVADVANKIIDVYLEERRERYIAEARAARDSLLRETEKAHQQLMRVETELQQFYSDNSLLLNFEKDRVQMGQWLDMEAQLRELETQEVQLLEMLKSLNQQLAQESFDLTETSLFHENVVNLEQNLTQLEIALRIEQQKFQPDAPEIRDLNDQITAVEAIIDKQQGKLSQQESKSQNKLYESLRAQVGLTESELAGVTAAIENKRKVLSQIKPEVARIPEKMQRTVQLQREQYLIEGQYKALNEKLVQATVSMASAATAPSAIRIVDHATPPEKPAWPKTKSMLFAALIIGSLVGIVTALLLDIIFIRANTQKLTANGKYRLYARLERDTAFVDRLYSRKAQA